MQKGRKRIFKLIALVITAMVFTSSCTTYASFKRSFVDDIISSEDTIYIGVFEPRSGDLAKQGNDEVKGIQLANKIYGNIEGVKVELIIVDNQSNTGSSKTAIEDLIEMKPVLIIGSAGEAYSMIASSYVKDAKIPTITPSATNPLITQGNDFFFRACITDRQRGEGLAEYAYSELKSNRIGIITVEEDQQAKMYIDGFKDKVDALSAKSEKPVVLQRTVGIEDVEMEGIAKAISASGADVVFMPVGIEKADLIFTQIETAGRTDITFLGEPSWALEDFAMMMEKHPSIKVAFPSDSVASETGTTQNSVTDETERFQIEYTNMYGADDIPTENTALGYDSYLLAINAIYRAKSTDPVVVRDALAQIRDLQCTTGVFSFDENGNPVREANIFTHKDGEVVLIYSSGSTEAKEIDEISTIDEEEVQSEGTETEVSRSSDNQAN